MGSKKERLRVIKILVKSEVDISAEVDLLSRHRITEKLFS